MAAVEWHIHYFLQQRGKSVLKGCWNARTSLAGFEARPTPADIPIRNATVGQQLGGNLSKVKGHAGQENTREGNGLREGT